MCRIRLWMKLGYLTFLLLGISVYSGCWLGTKQICENKKHGRNGKKTSHVFFFGGLDRWTGIEMAKLAPQKHNRSIFSLGRISRSRIFEGSMSDETFWALGTVGLDELVFLVDEFCCLFCWVVFISYFCKVWKYPIVFRYLYCVFFSKILLDRKIEYENGICLEPIGSMYGIFTYIHHKNQATVRKYTIRGSCGYGYVC